MNIQMREMQLADLDAVYDIEIQSFPTPWSREALEGEIIENDLACYLVLEADGEIVGYGGMWMILDEAHVTNVAILPGFRGQGLGRRLLEGMIQKARSLGADSMTLEVRPSNKVALALYEQYGFLEGGRRPGYYSDTGEDAILMWKNPL